jgi:hypothetical protein
MSTGNVPPKAPPDRIVEIRLADATFVAVFKIVAMASLSAALIWFPLWLTWGIANSWGQ